MSELIKQDVNAVDLFQKGELDPLLKSITKQVSDIVPDISSDKGRKEIASLAAKVARSKTYLDEVGKKYVAELKALPKQIDSERKRMRDYLDDLKETVRKPLTDWEEKEEKRKNDILSKIDSMNLPTDHELTTSAELKNFLSDIEKVVIDDSFDEFEGFAKDTKEKASLMLEGLIARKEKEEAEAEALLIKQKADQEKERAEREERIRKETEEKVKQEAERERVAAAERAELEKEAAIKAERLKAEKAEQERLAKEEAERVAAEKKAANTAHRAKINNSILAELMEYMPEKKAKDLIAKIAKGEIAFLSIQY